MDYAKYMHPADQICFVMKRIYDQDLTTLTGGNLSVIDSEGVMWVSPTGVDKSSLTREDIVRVYPDGHWEGKYKPTSEYRIHKRIYEERPEIKAVVHAHPPALVAMSATHLMPNPKLTYGAFKAFAEIGLAEYAFAGTLELVDCVAEVFKKGHNAAILKNHAAFLGSTVDLFDGCRCFEQLDFAARLQMNAWELGDARPATDAQIAQFMAVRQAANPQQAHAIAPAELEMRRELAALAKRAYTKKLFTGMEGVISGRVPGKGFVISPAAKDNAYIEKEDFVFVGGNGAHEAEKMPDGSYLLHQAIYEKHPKVMSVITACPVTAGAYAVCKERFDVTIIPESYGVLRDVLTLSAEQFIFEPEAVCACFDDDLPLCVVENLGLLMAGPTPVLTFDKLEVAESTAQSLQMARMAGKTIIPMTKEQQQEADKLG